MDSSSATGKTASAMTKADVSAGAFIKEAARGNDSEIALAEVAEKSARNTKVKELAEMIQHDHQNANRKLKPIAQAHGISVEQSLPRKEETQLTRLKKLSGDRFDKRYVRDMLRDHVADIAKFERASRQIKETDVKNYAKACLPTLRKHLEHAETAAKALGFTQRQVSSIEHKENAGRNG